MAPGAAAQGTLPPAWHDAGAALPTTVDLTDVAASGETVVAVGRDSATDKAVIFRRIGGTWQADTIADLPARSSLIDVAYDGVQAWAIGTTTDAVTGEKQPLVRRLATGGWVVPAAPLPDFDPTAVAVKGATALIGDSEGGLHRFAADGTTVADPAAAPRAKSVNGISLYAADTGFAVAGWDPLFPGDTAVGIYALNPDPMPELAQASTAGVDMIAVAATSAELGVALDSTETTWRLQDGNWVQETDLASELPEQRRLADLAAAPDGTTGFATEALVGSVSGSGAVWQRYRFEGRRVAWTSTALPAASKPLTGVAVTGREAAWAVGDAGTVLHYWRKPIPPPPVVEEDDDEEQQDEDTGTGQQQEEQHRDQGIIEASEEEPYVDEPPANPQPEPAANPDPAQAEEPETDTFELNGVIVEQPAPKKPETDEEKPAKRLLTDVKVARKGRKLIISFRLTAAARVAVVGSRGRKVVAKTRMRTLAKGQRRLVLRFRGQPPSSLKVVVRPAPVAKANRTRSIRREP